MLYSATSETSGVEVRSWLGAPDHNRRLEGQTDTGETPSARIRCGGVEHARARPRRSRTGQARERPESVLGDSETDGVAQDGLDIRSPFVADLAARSEQPQVGPWRPRRPREAETGLVGQPVLLAAVAAPAAGHHVVPAVRAATATRDDVVDVLCLGTAVLAAVTVADENRAPCDSHTCLVRHADIVDEANYGWLGELRPS